MAERLEGDSRIDTIRLGQNLVADPTPVLELIQTNGQHLRVLDISNTPFTGESIRELRE